jgi:predicted permease
VINPRQALRSLLKTPLVTGVAVVSLALGMGANAAIFSIFEHVVLRPLPVVEPERLVNLFAPGPKSGSQASNDAGDTEAVFSYPMLRDLENAAEVFTGIAAHRAFGANLAYGGDTLSSQGMLVSGSYFEVLGIQPALGRLFDRGDDQTPGAHPLVVLSHSYWQSRFNADPRVAGKTLTVNGRPLTILGVAPKGFSGTTLGFEPQVFVPISMRALMLPGWEGFEDRRSYWVYVFARLSPGISLEKATAGINIPYRAIIQGLELALQEGASERTLEQFKKKEIRLEPGLHGQSNMQKGAATPLLLLLGVTAFVLLIACANIANLLLIRATGRAGEIAVRLSLGAQRRQIVAQLLTESFLLSALGGALGTLVAHGTLRLLISLLPTSNRLGFDVDLGPSTVLFLVGLSLVTGLVGLFPALHSTREDLVSSLKSQGGKGTSSHAVKRFRTVMVTLQIALSMMLLTSAGLFTKSLFNVSRVDLGIDVEHIATFALSPELNGYTPAASRGLFERVEQELRGFPGVSGVVASLVPLIAGSNWGSNVSVQGFDAEPDTDTHSNYNEVGSGYFRTLGIPLLTGREFESRDDLGTPKVAIVNETFVEKFNLGHDAVGKRMQVGSGGELDIEIVGLVKDSNYSEVKGVIPPLFFLPYRQNESLGAINFYIRSSTSPEQLLPSLRNVLSTLDPNLPIENLRTMAMQVREKVALDRMLSTLSAAFALLATVLASVGLYGAMAYSVAQRRQEIGLRMALGANAFAVRSLVLRQVGWMALCGSTLGLFGALGLGRVAQSLLYEIQGHDPTVLVVSAFLLTSVSLGAGLLPAQRAASIDPMKALRDE